MAKRIKIYWLTCFFFFTTSFYISITIIGYNNYFAMGPVIAVKVSIVIRV